MEDVREAALSQSCEGHVTERIWRVHLQLQLNSTSHNIHTLKKLILDCRFPKPIRPVARCQAVYHQHCPEMYNYVFQLSYTPSITNYPNYPGKTSSLLMSIWRLALIISLAGTVANGKFTSEGASWTHSEPTARVPGATVQKASSQQRALLLSHQKKTGLRQKKRVCGRAGLKSTGNNLFV